MIIVCPQCESRYALGAESLPEAGRTVRCARCRAEWTAYPEPDGPDSLDDRPPVEPAEAYEAEADYAVDVLDAEPEPAEPRLEAAIAATGVEEIAARAEAPLRKAPKPARRRPRLPRPSRRFAVAAIGLAMVAGLVLAREPLVRSFPGSASLYASIGLPVNLRGLAFEDLRTRFDGDGGTPILVIEGTIRNVGSGDVAVPRLKLAIRDDKGIEVYGWTAMTAGSLLTPGQSMPFRSRLAAPPADGRSVAVRFLRREDMVAAAKWRVPVRWSTAK